MHGNKTTKKKLFYTLNLEDRLKLRSVWRRSQSTALRILFVSYSVWMCQSSNLQTGRGHEMGCLPSDYFFFISGWTGSLATGEFAFQFSSPKLPSRCRHGSVNVSLSIWCTELIYISVISRKTCLIMTINFSFPFVLYIAHAISYT